MTTKQTVFINEYLKDFNATQAAIRAGYSPKTAYSIGQENLKKPEISEAIKQRVSEFAMGEHEILLRLTDIARGDIADLMAIGSTGFNIELMQTDDQGNKVINPKTKLLKKVKQKVTTFISKTETGEDKEVVETEIELYSAQEALQFLAKLNGMVVDKISGPDGGPIPVEMIDRSLARAYGGDQSG